MYNVAVSVWCVFKAQRHSTFIAATWPPHHHHDHHSQLHHHPREQGRRRRSLPWISFFLAIRPPLKIVTLWCGVWLCKCKNILTTRRCVCCVKNKQEREKERKKERLRNKVLLGGGDHLGFSSSSSFLSFCVTHPHTVTITHISFLLSTSSFIILAPCNNLTHLFPPLSLGKCQFSHTTPLRSDPLRAGENGIIALCTVA